MSCIGSRVRELQKKITERALAAGRDPKEIQLVVVSKQRTVQEIEEAYAAGCRLFGESRVQELLDKQSQLPSDIEWHLIGTLQRKKVSKVVGCVALIHSADTQELVQKISQSSQERGCVSHILLEVNVSGEASKHGLSMEEWSELLPQLRELPNLSIDGLMTMAPLTEDREVIRRCFERLREGLPLGMAHLSMGMSHDWQEAVDAGATLLRIGSAIFEEGELAF
jgi:PLP dependent protein